MTRFEPGTTLQRRVVLHGQLWFAQPAVVVHDDGDVLAIRVDPGSAFHFPDHPHGPHPWSGRTDWGETIVLQLYRAGDLYSAWKVFAHDGTFRHWYVNFEAPVIRSSTGIDTDDHGLDLIIRADGTREWKDVTDLHHQRTEGRITEQTVIDVLCAAAGVEDALRDGDHWWRDWDDWTP
ncbi:DUF402 domain-containing protein [Nocardioides sp. Root151]|uniref:DUF402 domain-containing protein n=1 Tax=Nocardioides sp. Root151 TaxID=1736475 RepID=UPI000ADEA852|nr:DUF402 domain-containing protein [Nocardioides sp. Root151]